MFSPILHHQEEEPPVGFTGAFKSDLLSYNKLETSSSDVSIAFISLTHLLRRCGVTHGRKVALEKHSLFYQSHLSELQLWQKGVKVPQRTPAVRALQRVFSSSASLSRVQTAAVVAARPLEALGLLPLPLLCNAMEHSVQWTEVVRECSLHREVTVQTTVREDSGRPESSQKNGFLFILA